MWNRPQSRPTARILALWLAASQAAFAAGYPEKPITIIVSAAVGGASDLMTRTLGKSLSEVLGQPIVVENRGGAGGLVGIGAAARAKPDGYTLLETSSSYVLNPSTRKSIPYDPYKDFVPIVEIGISPNVFIVLPDSGINSMADLIALARSSNRVSFGNPGVGTTPQLAGEILNLRAKINMVSIPYSGGGQLMQGLLSRQVHVVVASLGSVTPQISGKLVKVIGQTGRERWPDLSEMPTMTEAGIPDAVSETFQAIFAPAGTPPEIVNRLARECAAILNQPATRELMRQLGTRVTASPPEALRARVAQEVPMWKDIIERAGIKPQD